MTETQNSKRYDLEDRTLNFAKHIIEFINKLPKTLTNVEICKQLVMSAGSVGANYIEANESLSKKDFVMRMKDMPQRGKRKLLLVKTGRLYKYKRI